MAIDNMSFEVLNIQSLIEIISYLIQNRDNKEKIIGVFGEVTHDNGYGSLFLNSENKRVWIHYIFVENDLVKSAGIRASKSQLKIKELVEFSKYFKEGFERYDDLYIYVFHKDIGSDYAVKITSKEKLCKEIMAQSEEILDSLTILIL
jgi:hypothetical protein